ncbi:protein O-mannosyl-transferase TMTC4-like [Tubulanus polymorphus]|uniref:protein O-mannosyl-transferase TMTC4-like n=1 Tax=Tubulanus polymorphus TaxID=672921 RepID=UPI003DA634CB
MQQRNVKKHGPHHHSKQSINSVKSVAPSSNRYENYSCRRDNHLPVPAFEENSLVKCSAIVFVLAIVCFGISYDGEFAFDDSEAIVANRDVTTDISLDRIFSHDFWGRRLNSSNSHKSYRPLTVLTFRFNYIVAGGLNPIGFHVTNILLHGVVCVLLLIVLNDIFLDRCVYSYYDDESCSKSAMFTTILFTIHPIHSENVAGLVGRADLLCAVSFLTSLIFYIRSCKTTVITRYVVCLSFSMIMAAVSVLCKEQGITVIGVCGGYDLLMNCKFDVFSLIAMIRRPFDRKIEKTVIDTNRNKSWHKSILPVVYNERVSYRLLLLFLVTSGLLFFRWRIMGSQTPTFQVVDNPHSFVNDTFFRVLNYNYLYALNAWLLLCPSWLCFDWSMGCVPVIESLADARLLAVTVFWLIAGLVVYVCLFKPPTKYSRLLTLSLACLVIPFLPASNIFFRVGFVIAERNLFLPSIGYCMLVTIGYNALLSNLPKFRQVLSLFCYIVFAVFVIRCIHRSDEWRQAIRLFESGEPVCPLNAKVHYNIGKVNSDIGNIERAIEKYRLAIRLFPDYDQPMNNLANILKDRGNISEAEALLEKAVSVNDNFAAAWMNLGIVQSTLKKYEQSERSYFNAIKHRRNYPDCYFNLGNLYLETKQHTKALFAWRNSTRLKPTHVSAWSNMIILLDNIEQYTEAERIAHKALEYVPKESQIYYNIANVLGKQSKYVESEKFFNIAIKINPKPVYFLNLGVLYHRWGQLIKAEKTYLKALELDAGLNHAHEYLVMVRKKIATSRQNT